MKKRNLLLLPALISLGLAGCNDSSSGAGSESLDTQLADVIATQGLTGDPSQNRSLPDITDPEAQLGMELFFPRRWAGTRMLPV